MAVIYGWRGAFTNAEANELQAEAFGTRVFGEDEWNWVELLRPFYLDACGLGFTPTDAGILSL